MCVIDQDTFMSSVPPKPNFPQKKLIGMILLIFVILVSVGWTISRQPIIKHKIEESFSNTKTIQSPPSEATPSTTTERNLDAITPASSTTEFVIGDPESAKLTIIEYIDLNCVYCKNYHQTLKTVTAEFDDEVAWVVRHFPALGSSKRAAWLECVGSANGEQEYWQFLDRYYDEVTSTPAAHDEEKFDSWLEKYGYNEINCSQDADLAKVAAQYQEGKDAGVVATPTIVIITADGTRDIGLGAMSPEDLRQVIESYSQ
jgi:protein-disulfide isomerase